MEHISKFLKTTTPNQYWLKQHQITAFWHGFGISNGLSVPKEEVELIKYSKGTPRQVYLIKPEFMQKKLKEYIKWLESYGESWNDNDKHPDGTDTYKKFIKDESTHESRANILKMIELLQKYN